MTREIPFSCKKTSSACKTKTEIIFFCTLITLRVDMRDETLYRALVCLLCFLQYLLLILRMIETFSFLGIWVAFLSSLTKHCSNGQSVDRCVSLLPWH